MAISHKPPRPTPALGVESTTHVAEHDSPSPVVFISEHAVVLATAAARPVQAVGSRSPIRAMRAVLAALQGLAPKPHPRATMHDHPARYEYLENSLMSGEMGRL